jgi:very-short-patch-repair endonuclease
MRSGKLTDRARTLRAHSTDAEGALWRHLRGSRLAGFKFRRQHPVHGYIADFICLEANLIVELDGSQHFDHASYDERRSQQLIAQGFRIIRFWNHDVLLRTEAVLEEILRNLREVSGG